MQNEVDLPQWKQFALLELSYLFANFLEYQQPGEAAARLETIARQLRENFSNEPDAEIARIEQAIEATRVMRQSKGKYFPGEEG